VVGLNKVSKIKSLIKQAEKYARQGDFGEKAREVNKAIIKLNSRANQVAYTRLAKCYVEEENLLRALEIYERVLELFPESQIAQNNLPKIKEQVKWEKALAKITDPAKLRSFGIDARKKGQIRLSISALERALKIIDSPSTHVALGATYRAGGHLNLARKEYLNVLENDPRNYAARVGLAAVYRDKKDYDKKSYGKNKKKEYYQKNRKKILTWRREYYEKNKEKLTKTSRQYYKKNKEKVKERVREYQATHKEQMKEYWRGYYKKKRRNL